MRRLWPARLLAVATSLALIGVAPTSAAARIPRGRLGIGDSIMRSAEDELLARRIPVNARVGRQFDDGLRLLRARAADGTLPKRMIVHLGTNGRIDPADCDSLVEAAGPSRRVFLVTVRVPRDWMRPNNLVLRACAERHERAHLVRWAMASGRHRQWFSDDGYHLNAVGQEAFAAYVDERVDAILASVLGAFEGP